MKTLQSYQCEICGKIYPTQNEAMKCESQGKDEVLAKVGQKVLIKMECYDSDEVRFYEGAIESVEKSEHRVWYYVDVYKTGWERYTVDQVESILGNSEFKERIVIVPGLMDN